MVIAEQQLAVPVRRRRLLPVLSAAAAVLVVAVIGTLVLNRPAGQAKDLQDYTASANGGSAAVGQTFYSDFDLQPAAGRLHTLTVDVTSLILRVEVNTAGATFAVVQCPVAADGTGILGAEAGAPGRCASTPVGTGPLLLSPHSQVILAVTPRHAGHVEVDGADLAYSVGHRHGKQHVGMRAIVAVP